MSDSRVGGKDATLSVGRPGCDEAELISCATVWKNIGKMKLTIAFPLYIPLVLSMTCTGLRNC